MESIIAVIITGAVSLIGTIITVIATSNKTAQDMKITQAVTDQKILGLTQEVRDLKSDVRGHNNYGSHITVLETKMEDILKRISNLEQKGA
ncbi:MAG: hypothetical protein IJM83_08465 [Firmicutes bacterium]|nr:hypothetical protein [Bacillota bacterium]